MPKNQKTETWEDHYPYTSQDERAAEELRIQGEDIRQAESELRYSIASIAGAIADLIR